MLSRESTEGFDRLEELECLKQDAPEIVDKESNREENLVGTVR